MKKIIAMLLALLILFSCCVTLISCAPTEDVPPIIPGGDEDDNPPDDDDENDDDSSTPSTSPIVVPTYKDYERGTVDFDKLTYARPDVDKLRQDFADAKKAVEEADTEDKVNEAIALIVALEEPYSNFKTMATMAEIQNYQNSANEEWATEYEHLSVARSSVAQVVEELIVAAAKSDFIEKYENDYFGYQIDEYADGGIYTDTVVTLMGEEASLVAEYNGISTATVELNIEQYGERGTYDELVAAAAAKYGTNSMQYMMRYMTYGQVYNTTVRALTEDLYVSLIKKRKEIANELGMASYTEFMYDQMGYDYTPEEMTALFGEVKGTVFEVYSNLLGELYDHLYTDDDTKAPKGLSRTQLINTLYTLYTGVDEGLGEVYSYMLQHKLYDISGAATGRYDGAFTAYLDSNSSPFLFATISGNITDFSTVSHEFGHFYDAYVNYDGNNSLELCEVSSQALEYMTLNMLESKLETGSYQYMRYYYVYNALTTIIYQSIYSMYEHLVYALPYEDITIENLNALVPEAAIAVTGSAVLEISPYDEVELNSIHTVLVPHMVIAPMYVQSYVTSIIPALEIYSLEANEEGEGLRVYKALVDGADEDKSFTEHLEAAGLASPFDEGVLTSIASALHKLAIGIPYAPSGSIVA